MKVPAIKWLEGVPESQGVKVCSMLLLLMPNGWSRPIAHPHDPINTRKRHANPWSKGSVAPLADGHHLTQESAKFQVQEGHLMQDKEQLP